MIKQLLSSAGTSKETGLATNITKSANTKGDNTSRGLFDSILKTVQGFGQQEQSEQSASKKDDNPSEESSVINNPSPKKLISEDEGSITDQKEEAGEKEITGTGDEVKSLVSEKVAEMSENDIEVTGQGNTKPEIEEAGSAETKGNEATVSGNELKAQIAETAGQPVIESQEVTQESISDNSKIENQNADTAENQQKAEPAAESIVNQKSYEVNSAKASVAKADSLLDESLQATGFNEEKVTGKAITEEVNPEVEQETEVQETETKSSSSTGNLHNNVVGSSLAAEGNILQKTPLKGVEQVSVKAIKSQQVSENNEAKNAETETAEATTESAVRMATEQAADGAPELAQGIQSQKAQEVREKRFRDNYSFSGRHELNSERLEIITQSRESKAQLSFLSQFEAPVQAVQNHVNTSSGSTMTTEQEMILKEHLKESMEVTEQKDASNAMFARLGEIPVSNMLVRRTIMPSLTQAVQKTISAGKASPETWQKHSFELEDGNSIQLSTRQVDGVLQVKLVSTSIELTRLMQQYEQEIKQHLEQECQLDVNLQFDGGEGGETMSNFFRDSSSSQKTASMRNGGIGSEQASTQNTDKNLQQSVRRFGYNQMEWTA